MKERITLATLPRATAQEVFDQVVGGIIKQGVPAKNHIGRCLYRTPSGLACAAGQLLTDEEVTLIGGPDAGSWRYMHSVKTNKIPAKHVDLVQELQVCHDEASDKSANDMMYSFMAAFKASAVACAAKFSLDASIINQE